MHETRSSGEPLDEPDLNWKEHFRMRGGIMCENEISPYPNSYSNFPNHMHLLTMIHEGGHPNHECQAGLYHDHCHHNSSPPQHQEDLSRLATLVDDYGSQMDTRLDPPKEQPRLEGINVSKPWIYIFHPSIRTESDNLENQQKHELIKSMNVETCFHELSDDDESKWMYTASTSCFNLCVTAEHIEEDTAERDESCFQKLQEGEDEKIMEKKEEDEKEKEGDGVEKEEKPHEQHKEVRIEDTKVNEHSFLSLDINFFIIQPYKSPTKVELKVLLGLGSVKKGLCMKTRSGGEPLAERDPKPERSLLQRRRREESAMKDQYQEEGAEKTMEHYVQSNPNAQRSAIVIPEVPSNFEIKPQILSMIQNNYQFGGLTNEDPNEHIEKFLEICDTFRFKDVTNEAVWLRIFPFTLRDRAKSWYHTLPPQSIRTWDELQRKFLSKYFPPAKTIKLRNAISNFMQEHDEQFCEAWERFKELLRKCPNHGIPRWMQMEIFYNGITISTRSLIDAAAGGTMNKKTPNEVYELIEEIASNMYQYPVERSARGRFAGIHNVDPVLALQAQVESLTKQLSKLHTPSLVAQICDMCGGGYPNHECQAGNIQAVSSLDQANYVSNFRRPNDPYNNTYNPGWRNHPNFSWNNNQQSSTQQPNAQTRPPPGFQRAAQEQKQKASFEDIVSKFLANQEKRYAWTDSRFQAQEASLKNQEASIRKLEIQVGQLANVISDQQQDKEREEQDEGKEVSRPYKQKSKSSQTLSNAGINVDTLPYPERDKKDKLEDKFSKFVDIFKKLEINIPFVEALMQMPQYAKFLKEVLSEKRKVEEQGTVMLTESCSAILKNQLPTKLKDPESFTIPCEFGNFKFNKVLCDLEASINLMPLSICRKLNLGELKETNIMLQFADRSTKKPNGLIEDLLVRIGKFIYPCDFVVLDMEVDWELPLILGRPFLAIAAALIDVKQGKLTLRLNDEEIVFDIKQAIKSPSNLCDDTCDSLERCLAQSCTKEDDDPLM
ncbi:hypothetical protein H6P81_013012 [Aristolochia fimbriata]|uniref:Retrotransposon gag domain-containing protein n=1 Tax=Aristolochia fimbriata TaxID=158543 RepID=A0AAV7EDU7_ARIFI|nr:hypothetical protein H6P81_013012 [Aristolochia fimbriata]